MENEKKINTVELKDTEMVIEIEKYENMKREIKYLKEKEDQQFNLRQTIREENLELRSKNSKLEKEVQALWKGIIKFVKYFGGND
nr:MAG TPA: hypothetical protein [Caudoviricetes sp.]